MTATRPEGARLRLPTGDCLPLVLVESGRYGADVVRWLAYGPAGVGIAGCELLVDVLPPNTAVELACRWNGANDRWELVSQAYRGVLDD